MSPHTAHTRWPRPAAWGDRWHRLLDAVLGPKCPRCLCRVFPRDQRFHDEVDCT